ncbi:Hypothetical protein IALB_2621 [Ignavibacterium album JCM 16511]|uniref:Lipoprotein n=1 Tax=Ignavibacterium album (strain DSM 19864 / JCM 16511 / NBRC 101810 / Mat9-16) TaxID=945713 RepID=I0AMW7_IGNAJ|nr:hypothetical protein [Ignavibacterium album]AFH50324.1 Hypothetical protein IALB_2621 [Ignavibacterium album JCM 16511]
MKKNFLLILTSLFLNGCVLFNTVSYEITMRTETSGSALVRIYDICTDASNEEEEMNDVNNVFDYAAKSSQFIADQEIEGKKITNRKLFVEGNQLNGMLSFDFDDINKVEGIQFDDPYYYLTLNPEDSVVSTNGQLFEYDNYKRIVWDKSIRVLKFTMFSEDTDKPGLKKMSVYFNKEN